MNSFKTFHVESRDNNLKKNSVVTGKKFFSDRGFEETFSRIKLDTKNEESYADIMKKMITLDDLAHQLHFDESEEDLNKEEHEKLTMKKGAKKKIDNPFWKKNSKLIKIYKLPQLKITQDNNKKDDKVKNLLKIKLSVIPEYVKEKAKIFKPEKSSTKKTLKFIHNETNFVFDSNKFSKSRRNPLALSQNSFDNVLSTDLNSMAENYSLVSISEKREREKLMCEDLSEKYGFQEFPNSIQENLKKFDSKLKESKKKISRLINQYKFQEKTYNKSLEISKQNLVFIYDINSRIDIEKDDITKKLKKKNDFLMFMNHFKANKNGNILKDKNNLIKFNKSEELSAIIRNEKHKQVQDMLDKAEIKKKILIKRIKIKNI